MAEHRHKKKEDLILIFLIILGFGALVMGFSQFRATIKGKIFNSSSEQININDNQNLNNLVALKTKDTDGDGLTDYDEIYVYHTSPYLTDSDSDGYSDKEEIASGYDPNCSSDQTGMPCNSPLTKIDIYNTSTEQNLIKETNGNFNQQNILSGQASASEVRALMLQAGMNKEDLDKITDEQLLETYRDTLSKSGETQTNSNLNLPVNSSINFNPDNISAEELRQLLLNEGIDKNMLDKIDDATLKQMFLEAMKKDQQ